MKASKQTLYDPRWQVVRMRVKGGWTKMFSVQENLKTLQKYLAENEYSRSALWRVVNLLNAVRMGHHGMGIEQETVSGLVRTWRAHWSILLKQKAHEMAFEVLSDEETLRLWREIGLEDQIAIAGDLLHRWQLHPNKETRPELRHFLDLIESE